MRWRHARVGGKCCYHLNSCLAYDRSDFPTALEHLDRACKCFRRSQAVEQGLLPRTLLKLGSVKVVYAQSISSSDEAAALMAEGLQLIDEGTELARQIKGVNFKYSSDADGDSLVRPTYW